MRRMFFVAALAVLCFLIASCEAPAGNSANSSNRVSNASNGSNTTNASTASNAAAAEAEIRKLMDTAQAALGRNDADAMANIYADNYMLVNLDGSVQTKAERLASLRSGEAKYTGFTYSEPNIRINAEGTGAVVIAKLALKGTFRGRPADGDYRVTQVYSKMNGTWKQVSAQATAITAATGSGSAASNSSDAARPANTSTAPVPPAANTNR